MRIPYGFDLTASGAFEMNESIADVVSGASLITAWQEQVWARSWIYSQLNRFSTR
jgi:hypothetical protein